MNILSRDKQIDIIASLCEGVGIRATARLTNTNRKTVGRLALHIGRGCAELHDRMMVGLRVPRLELDELWAFVGCKQKRVTAQDALIRGDQYTFIALAASAKAIIAYHTGKRNADTTDLFVRDLRERVLGSPEISSDGYYPYTETIRHAFGDRVAHGVIVKRYSAGHLDVPEAARRYSPAAVVAVSRDVISGAPAEISTSYVERQNLTVRMASRRFTRLTNGFSKKLENHAAAVSLYVTHYNLCRVHETLSPDMRHQTTPAMALGLTDHPWSIGALLDAALATDPSAPENAPDRPRFRVIEGGRR
jgi:IS1 family transposase